jgi:hypothetical protein
MAATEPRDKGVVAMLLREITIQNLRLCKHLHIPFEHGGRPRQWTVLIGRNGAGKTSVLQAIALAAAGNSGAINLAETVRDQLPDVRSKDEASIVARFGFGEIGQRHGEKPHKADMVTPTGLGVELKIPTGRDPLRGFSWYTDESTSDWQTDEGVPPEARPERPATEDTDPLVKARAKDLNHWFVAGYGMFRHVQERQIAQSPPSWPSVDRLRPLFQPVPLIGPNFMDILADLSLKRDFGAILQQIIKGDRPVLPGIVDMELRGHGGVKSARDLMDRSRFVEQVGREKRKFPATWFAHGHQSTIAWLSDLVGQILLEAGSSVDPRDMEGIVLIDEIDLYLHPTWQVTFISALRETFPKMQFVSTTHSPILLTGLHRDEVFILERDEVEGNITCRNPDRDPRLLTGSELYEEFFEIKDLYPTDLARMLDDYRSLAMNPLRSEDSEAEIDRLERALSNEGIAVRKRAPRMASGSEAAE